MALRWGDLNEIDQVLITLLREDRVTPVYCREWILDAGLRDKISSTYCGQRLQRLEEHGHVDNLYGVGLYELVDDPSEWATVETPAPDSA